MTPVKSLCVYCSSSRELAPEYYAGAEAVGRGMAARGWGLVYGGGKVGMMGATARAVKRGGGRVVGVIPEFMKARELAYDEADELHVVATMAERKAAMIARAAGFLALPGGVGTLEEVAEVITLRYLAQIDKPVVFLNQNGFYDDLLRFFRRMADERFRGTEGLFAVADSVDQIWPLLETPAPYEPEELWRSPG
jgi:uncharacterized protein (TIGR00730 family)